MNTAQMMFYSAALGFSFGAWQWDLAAGGWMLLISYLAMQARWGRRDTEGGR